MIKSSVIIPVYNTEKYLVECIESVLGQTQKEVEIILVDDGSTDHSDEIISKYEKNYENVISIFQENQRQGAARNIGTMSAHGKYIYFLDSDDYIDKITLEKCYYYAEKNNVDFLMFDALTIMDSNHDLEQYRDNYDRTKLGIADCVFSGREYWLEYYGQGGVYACPPLTYIKKDFLIDNKLFFEKGVVYEDNEWILRMFLSAERVYYCPLKLYYRRYRKFSTMTETYNLFHLDSAGFILGNLLDLYCGGYYNDSWEIIRDVILDMISRCNHIVNEIAFDGNKEKLREALISFGLMLLDRLKILESLNNEIYVSVLILTEVINRRVDFLSDAQVYREILRKKICNKYKLEEKMRIGIYGIGEMCDEIFRWYSVNKITIRADISFLVSGHSEAKYRGYPIYSIESIDYLNLDYVIIASRKFQKTMMNNLVKHWHGRKKIGITYGNLGV